MLIPMRVLAWFFWLCSVEWCFVQLVNWKERRVVRGVIFMLLYCMKMIYPEGLGGGDIKLLSLLGFSAGLKGVFMILFFESFFSLCFCGAVLVLQRMKMRTQFTFGPFISLGAIW